MPPHLKHDTVLLPWFYRSENRSPLGCEVKHSVGVRQLWVLGCILTLPCFRIWRVISPPALGVSVTLWTLSLPWPTPTPKTSVKYCLCCTPPLFWLTIYSSAPAPPKFFQHHWDLESPILPFPSRFHLSYAHPSPTHHTSSLPLQCF